MNAPVSIAILAARATLPSNPQPEQPQVPDNLSRLATRYLHGNLILDLHGYADEDEGCSVEAVSLTGTRDDISELVSPAQMKQMGWAVDRAAVRAKQASRAEDRADRAAWDRAAIG
ncbi:hypothetical protein GJ699_02365 [Duganella sp. FT80W]|uniref:Uncharacterized protein n=1 Tax=Duganella guangzhouensis TaxID=2666084 RepID=A0A6I2KWM9_9BURK|nr:hypothetical protein [Duganella guangzhouensis]MRW88824.1 hypothetical protein [Duganella guangzhouensis]